MADQGTAKVAPDLTRQGVVQAHALIMNKIKRTPVLTCESISLIASTESRPTTLFFKCENFQKGGAFKLRGATHALEKLSPEQLRRGVVTHSSGNHAQALAITATAKGTKSYIVMPASSAKPKIEGTRGYGGEVYLSGPSSADRDAMTAQIKRDTGAIFVPPYDHPDIILGQGTVMLELLEQTSNELNAKLDAVVVPVGGGGLLAGCALAAQGTGVRVFAAEPAMADDCFRGIASGERVAIVPTTATIADGLRSPVGAINFPLIQQNVEKIFTATEAEILSAMRLIWERMKIVVEPSSAVPLAVVLSTAWRQYGVTGNVGIVVTGGNVDMDKAGQLLAGI
ncbi:tryptophan synthase beta subunit-like PLP-dependent enzyme [Limtongia smithiae]|uniref:tryptophan synthase beta subunit-like PLP-dependent enzyme n=1 Tax=Limtongia smithiae TaxID=1125753 RepID=UPI0034CF60F2